MNCKPHTMQARKNISLGMIGKTKKTSLMTDWRPQIKERKSRIMKCEDCQRKYLQKLGCLFCKNKDFFEARVKRSY